MKDIKWTCWICQAERESWREMMQHLKYIHNQKYLRTFEGKTITKKEVVLASIEKQLTIFS